MAKDRITIFIPEIDEEAILAGNSWVSKNQKGKWAVHDVNKLSEKHKRRIPRYLYGSMSCKSGLLDIEFLKYSTDQGDLLISLSVGELYFSNNSYSKSNINIVDLVKRIETEYSNVLDIACIPPWDVWVISRDETFIDIIDWQENIIRRMEILGKSYFPYKKVDKEYKDNGSVYFRGRTGKKSSSQFIAYDKVKEQFDRKGIDLREILDLDPQEGCLRLELKTKKNSLKKSIEYLRKLPDVILEDDDTNFSLVMSQKYQENVLMKVITELNLDKTITTRSNLLKILKNSGKFTKRQYRTVVKVIDHENDEKHPNKLSPRTIKNYRKVITSLGFHYLYSDIELKPITIKMVREAIFSSYQYTWLNT